MCGIARITMIQMQHIIIDKTKVKDRDYINTL